MAPFLGPFFKSINSKATKKQKNKMKNDSLFWSMFQINQFEGHQKTKKYELKNGPLFGPMFQINEFKGHQKKNNTKNNI